MIKLLVMIAVLFAPIFTCGVLLWHYGHPVMGFIAIIISLLNSEKK